MSGYGGNLPANRAFGQPRRDGHGTVRIVAAGRGRVRVRKSSGCRLRDVPELDLRTPSGRLLPY